MTLFIKQEIPDDIVLCRPLGGQKNVICGFVFFIYFLNFIFIGFLRQIDSKGSCMFRSKGTCNDDWQECSENQNIRAITILELRIYLYKSLFPKILPKYII